MSAWTFCGLTSDEILDAVDFAKHRGWPDTKGPAIEPPAPDGEPDHDAVRDGWESLADARERCFNCGDPGHVACRPVTPEPFTPGHLLSLFTRAPKTFWRFDCDFSLDAAVRMAEFAETAGVKAHFYILATGAFYNPFSPSGARAIEQIRAHGHKVGMHVDERVFPDQGAPGVPALKAVSYARRLFHGTVVDWEQVSFHMPTPVVLWRTWLGSGFESAYAEHWKGHYVSDSRREWDAEKEQRLTAGAGDGMQCALHPEHWFGS